MKKNTVSWEYDGLDSLIALKKKKTEYLNIKCAFKNPLSLKKISMVKNGG